MNTHTKATDTTGIDNQTGRRYLTMLILALAVAILSTACLPGSGGDEVGSEALHLGSIAETAETDDADADTSAGHGAADEYSPSNTRAVVLVDQMPVFDAPGGNLLGTMSSTTEYGTNRVLLAEATEGDWVRVRLPMRPNHTTAWVAAGQVKLENVEPTVEVDLATRTLTVRSAGTVLAQATVAVGSEEYPTPRGTFYITDKLETPDPGGAYGPYALGLSGYSETLSEFGGGDGQIGIHGTNDPSSLGQAVSHGCIRLPNDVVTLLADVLPLGTPVHVV
ncbi:MAG: L,D-transpeptidase [Acidimicrobiia bacterium]|nr:L,D-transpeptidase [Acidimicrobiia bacterium]